MWEKYFSDGTKLTFYELLKIKRTIRATETNRLLMHSQWIFFFASCLCPIYICTWEKSSAVLRSKKRFLVTWAASYVSVNLVNSRYELLLIKLHSSSVAWSSLISIIQALPITNTYFTKFYEQGHQICVRVSRFIYLIWRFMEACAGHITNVRHTLHLVAPRVCQGKDKGRCLPRWNSSQCTHATVAMFLDGDGRVRAPLSVPFKSFQIGHVHWWNFRLK